MAGAADTGDGVTAGPDDAVSAGDKFPPLSVVIPTYKEAKRLPATLREIIGYLERRFTAFEILVVDDNSSDGTAAAALAEDGGRGIVHVLTQPGRLGKGAAVRRGCMAARHDRILFMDADHATPIEEVELMLAQLPENGVTVGVRTYQEDEAKWRRIIGLCAQLLAHLVVFEKPVIDSQCGFKLFTAAAVRQVFPRCRTNGGMIDVELFFLIHKFSVPCRYQPVHWVNKAGSKVSVLRSVIFDSLDMVRIRSRNMIGLYDRPLTEAEQPWSRLKE